MTTDFHPILQGELQGVARKFLESGESTLLQNMSGQSAPKDIRISFRNGRMNLQDIANSMGRKAGVPEVDRPIAVWIWGGASAFGRRIRPPNGA